MGGLKVLIPLAGLVDIDAELSRVGKQLAREEGLLKQSRAKMGNKRFVDNAPAAVVEQEQERLDAHEGNVQRLRDQINRLQSLERD